ncbi:MAG: DUF3592 domain-containing protein [Clostridia bacterium]|nr:DUF3592 domain-containing protein [Clostridia bacterium]
MTEEESAKRVNILCIVGILLLCIMVFLSITPISLLIKEKRYSGTNGTIIETTTHNMSENDKRVIRYTYKVSGKEYTSFNLYGLTSFTKVPEDNSLIVYYDASDPENTSITSLEIHQVFVEWIIKELAVVFVGILYVVIWFWKLNNAKDEE